MDEEEFEMYWHEAPCLGCGEPVEGFVEAPGEEDDWWGTCCFSIEKERRMKLRIAELEVQNAEFCELARKLFESVPITAHAELEGGDPASLAKYALAQLEAVMGQWKDMCLEIKALKDEVDSLNEMVEFLEGELDRQAEETYQDLLGEQNA